MDEAAQALAHCLELVRTRDHDRYLTILHAPAAKRPALAALYALHCELAVIPDRVSEPMLALIRYQWWLDALADAAAGKARAHPVLLALAHILPGTSGVAEALQAGIESRMDDLDAGEDYSLAHALALAQGAGGSLQAAAALVLDAAAGHAALAACRSAGSAAWIAGVAGALLQQPDAARRNQLLAPLLRAGLAQVSQLPRLPGPVRAAALLAPLARDRLNRIARAGGNPARAQAEAGAVWRQVSLAWAALTGRL